MFSDEPYRKIALTTYYDYIFSSYNGTLFFSENYVSFTKDEMEQIKELLPEAEYYPDKHMDKSRIDVKGNKFLIIIKMKDEWFYVSIDNRYFFQCDQFDGLLELIKDKLPNNINNKS